MRYDLRARASAILRTTSSLCCRIPISSSTRICGRTTGIAFQFHDRHRIPGTSTPLASSAQVELISFRSKTKKIWMWIWISGMLVTDLLQSLQFQSRHIMSWSLKQMFLIGFRPP